MYCRNCGKELPDNSNFCPNCGKKQKDERVVRKTGFEDLLKTHKKLSYTYLLWCLLHLTLFLSSSKDNPDGFYPWNKSISYLLGGGEYYGFSLLDEDNVYDLSELFFYTILLPIVILGIVKLWPYMKPFGAKLINWYNHWKEENAKKAEEYQAWKEGLQKSQLDVSSSEIVTEKATPPSPNTESVLQDDEEELQSSYVPIQSEVANQISAEEETATVEGPKKFPLFRRLVGTIIDKVLLLVIFVVGSIIISPYGASGRLGSYVGYVIHHQLTMNG